jgi:hypothetical protein
MVRVVDTERDRSVDQRALRIYGTDPGRANTDGDGLSDGSEVARWRDVSRMELLMD